MYNECEFLSCRYRITLLPLKSINQSDAANQLNGSIPMIE